MTSIYLMRHGQTMWNVEERLQGSGDSPLTETGVQQARKAAKRIQEIKIETIYSSPLQRAVETAKPAAKALGVKPILHAGLREISLGKWEGKTYSEIKALDPEGYQTFFHQPSAYEAATGGETFEDVRKRAVRALEEIAAAHIYQKILVVSHAITIRVLLTHYLPCSLNDLWHLSGISQTSLSEIRFGGEQRQVGSIGCVLHLTDERFLLDEKKTG